MYIDKNGKDTEGWVLENHFKVFGSISLKYEKILLMSKYIMKIQLLLLYFTFTISVSS